MDIMDIVDGSRIMKLHFDSDDDLAVSISSTSNQSNIITMYLDEEKALSIAKLILKKYNITKIKPSKSIELS